MISIVKDHSQDLTLFTVSGELSVDEMLAAVASFYSSQPTKLALLNLLEARGNAFNPDDLDRIISLVSKNADKRKGGKTAVVASRDYVYGLSRMHKAKSEAREIKILYHITRSMDEARQWLGVVKK